MAGTWTKYIQNKMQGTISESLDHIINDVMII